VQPLKVVEQRENLERKVERDRQALVPPPAAPITNVPQGGLQQHFNTNNSKSTTHIGSVTVNSPKPVDGYNLQDQLRMAGG